MSKKNKTPIFLQDTEFEDTVFMSQKDVEKELDDIEAKKQAEIESKEAEAVASSASMEEYIDSLSSDEELFDSDDPSSDIDTSKEDIVPLKKEPLSRTKLLVILLSVGIVLLFAVVFFGYHYLSGESIFGTPEHNTNEDLAIVTMINVVGMTEEEAVKTLNEQHLRAQVVYSQTDDTPGIVLEQSAEPGTTVNSSRIITLTVSEEKSQLILDDLTGMTRDDAIIALTQKNLNPFTKLEESDTVLSGCIIRTEPAAGTPVSKGDEIKLFISAGPHIEYAYMPNLISMTQDEAVAELDRLELSYEIVYQPNQFNEGRVIGQSVSAGTSITKDVSIVVTVGSHYEPEPQSEAETVSLSNIKIPSFIGLSESEASDKCSALGIYPAVIYEVNDQNKGKVFKQDIAAGSDVPEGSKITLYIGTSSQTQPTTAPTETPAVQQETTEKQSEETTLESETEKINNN